MTAWLRENEPARSQFRSPRRARLRPVIVVHTAESIMDTIGPDTGAENVANFILRRDTPGSYHDLVDSDSCINLVDYDDEAFQDGTGSNPWALSVSFACRTIDWARMTPERRRAFLDQGARAAARQARHVFRRTGEVVLARTITRAQSDAGEAGFIPHGWRDPKRRTDPGTTAQHPFPWAEFLALFRIHAADLLGITPGGLTVSDIATILARLDQLDAKVDALTTKTPTLSAIRDQIDFAIRGTSARVKSMHAGNYGEGSSEAKGDLSWLRNSLAPIAKRLDSIEKHLDRNV